MRLYLVEFDNGGQYDDNENYVCGIFDTYEKAKNFCLSWKYEEMNIEGYFKNKCDFENKYFGLKSLEIVEVGLNKMIREID
jgi:hypothetical protein